MRPEVEIVRAGYDTMAERYRLWAAGIADPQRVRLVADLDARLPDGSRILDLGCGNGLPSTADLARRHRVHGVDVSSAQVVAARTNVSGATFECTDLLGLEAPADSFDAVVSLYALTHVPRELHAQVLSRIHEWLRPGGLLLATLSARGDSDGVQADFLGVPMFFSGFGVDTNRELVGGAGFELLVDETAELHEPDGVAAFHWILAQRP